MYQFSVLNNVQAIAFDKLTYPAYRQLLKVIDTNQSIIAIGVHLDSQAVGLGLAIINKDDAEIVSLFIRPEHRGKRLGKTLLHYIETELEQRGCSEVSLVYISNATTPALERILEQLNWSIPQLRMLVCSCDIEKFKDASWLKLEQSLPNSYTIFPWFELTHQERKLIQKQQTSSAWYPEILSPFKEEEIIEPTNSLGLRYQNQVVGWMITHRVAVDTVRYTALFVKNDLQRLGRGIALLARAIQLQLKQNEVPKAVCTVVADNAQMVKFVDRRLAPYLNSTRHSWGAVKSFR